MLLALLFDAVVLGVEDLLSLLDDELSDDEAEEELSEDALAAVELSEDALALASAVEAAEPPDVPFPLSSFLVEE